MTAEPNVLIVNKQALIEAALEMEKQEALMSFMMLYCIDQLSDLQRKLEFILNNNQASQARGAFLELFMSTEDWGTLLSDERFAQWEAEWQAHCPPNFKAES
jgi:hypothetical protein